MSAWRAWRKPWTLGDTEKLLKAGAIREPVWWEAYKMYPPFQMPIDAMKKQSKEDILEKKLLKEYYKRNPQAKLDTTIDLFDEDQQIPAIDFVYRWKDLIVNEGLRKQAAYKQVELEFKKAKEVQSQAAAAAQSEGGVEAAPVREEPKDELVSLRNRFDEWCEAEDYFWQRQAEAKAIRDEKRRNRSR